MLVVGQAAQDRRRADIGQFRPGAEQRQHHFRIEETAAIEQREDEIDAIGPGEQRVIAVGDLQPDAESFEDRAHFMVIDGMITVLRVERDVPQRVLGDEQGGQALARFVGDAGRDDRLRHDFRYSVGSLWG